MGYAVKEIYYTLQGEGAQSGRPAVFLRFTGCNLWSGREEDRARAPGGCGRWCDTDFVGVDGPGGGRFPDAAALADAVAAAWPEAADGASVAPAARYVVCTGGEPLLQLDEALIEALHLRGFQVGVETNGTKPAPAGLDHLCVSPKAGSELVLTRGDELKLVYPQPELPPELFEALDFHRFSLQPLDGPERLENTAAALAYCLANPRWQLSLQTHKILEIP